MLDLLNANEFCAKVESILEWWKQKLQPIPFQAMRRQDLEGRSIFSLHLNSTSLAHAESFHDRFSGALRRPQSPTERQFVDLLRAPARLQVASLRLVGSA